MVVQGRVIVDVFYPYRHLEHSTIIYEDPQQSPLLRLSWNKQDPNYLATFSLDAVEVKSHISTMECHF